MLRLLGGGQAPSAWAPALFAAAVAAIAACLIAFAIVEERPETRRLAFAVLATGAAAVALVAPKRTLGEWSGVVLLGAAAALFWAYYLEIVRFPLIQGIF
jgi:hypothetical protein